MKETDQELVIKGMNIYGGHLLFPGTGDLCEYPVYGIFQYFRCQLQLHQIIGYLIGQSISGHLEILIAGKDDKVRTVFTIAFPTYFCEIQTAHYGHFDIRDHNLRRFFLDDPESCLTVHGSAADLDI